MKIRVTLTTGMWIDFDAPDDFSIPIFISSIRATGYWLHPNVYVPHDKIVAIGRLDGDAVAPVKIEGTLQ